MITDRHLPLWRFGPFEADAAEHQLRRDGEVVPVTRKSFALLATLLSRPGKLFTKAELFDSVWAGTVVTDAALSRAIRELRVALGDDAAAPRYIATAHGLGFRFVALVAVDLPAADPATRALAADPRFVGRDRELALLAEALAGARAGRRQTVFVTGEAGIGKTALVEAFLARPEVRSDVRTTQGRCVEQYGTGEAYLPILEALEHLAQGVGADRMREVLLRYAPAWLAQLPWLAHDADAESIRRATVDGSAQRMLREIAQALEVLAAERPVVLWLEDLHWSDPSSLAVIAFLAGRREPARLLLVASFRPADAQAGASPLHGLALQLAQRGQAMPLALGLLDEAAIAGYLRARFAVAPALPIGELAAFLHRRTDGNALFTVAMVDDLVRSRHLVEADGAWTLHGSVAGLGEGLPDDLRHLVHTQIERLDAEDRRLVEAAAVAGTDFAAAHVAAALQCDVASVEDRCTRLALSGRFLRAGPALAWPDGTESGGFGFLHALYWQGTHERVPQTRRAEWQRRIALAQEAAYGAQSSTIAAELAMRFEAAHDIERSIDFLQKAGANALARCAYAESVQLLRHGLELVPRLRQERQVRRELDLLLPLGPALMTVQGYASDEVEATYQRALVLSRIGDEPEDVLRVLRGLWNVLFSRSELAQARAAAEQLLDMGVARKDDVLIFDARGKLGHSCLHRGDFADAVSNLERALAMTDLERHSTYRREAPRLLACLAWAHWYIGRPDQGLACAERAVQMTEHVASPHTKAYVFGYASMLHSLRGEGESALALARRQAAISAEHGLEYWQAWSDLALGWAEGLLGEAPRGATRLQTGLAQMRALGTIVGSAGVQTIIAELWLAAGRVADARAVLLGASDFDINDGHVRHAAECARLRGKVALAAEPETGRGAAEQAFGDALRIAREQASGGLELRAATDLAQLWLEDGRSARALPLLTDSIGRFEEGRETADLQRAIALLERLRGTPS